MGNRIVISSSLQSNSEMTVFQGHDNIDMSGGA